MKPKNTEIDFHKYFIYDSESGILYHKEDVCNVKAGSIAGAKHCRGYTVVSCRRESKPRRLLAHRVCWKMYYGNWPKGQINHKNGIKTDNRICNLEDVTNAENRAHAVKHGLQGKGERKGGVLTEQAVGDIRYLLKEGFRVKDLAEFCGTSKATIGLVRKGSIWKHAHKDLIRRDPREQWVSINGDNKILGQWMKEIGCVYSTLYSHVRAKGWTLGKAIAYQIQQKKMGRRLAASNSVKVICAKTKIVYPSLTDAALDFDIQRKTLSKMVFGKIPNTTTLSIYKGS